MSSLRVGACEETMERREPNMAGQRLGDVDAPATSALDESHLVMPPDISARAYVGTQSTVFDDFYRREAAQIRRAFSITLNGPGLAEDALKRSHGSSVAALEASLAVRQPGRLGRCWASAGRPAHTRLIRRYHHGIQQRVYVRQRRHHRWRRSRHRQCCIRRLRLATN